MARQEVRRQREGGGVTDHLEDLLTTVTRDRARACADLSEARIEMQVLELSYRNALLDLSAAREMLAYHGLTPVDSGGE
jgi:hypothetical protein